MAKFGKLDMAWNNCFDPLLEHEKLKLKTKGFGNHCALTKSVVNFQAMTVM
jgi:hypothetical protein